MPAASNDFRVRRRRLDLSQVDIAAQLGVSHVAISLIERSAATQRRALADRLDDLLRRLERTRLRKDH